MINSIVLAVLVLTGCVSPNKKPPTSVERVAGVALGTDKADVLKAFGAPTLIEIDAQLFRYTYVNGPSSKVIIIFDDKHKVSAISK
jgi:hypothetical protein